MGFNTPVTDLNWLNKTFRDIYARLDELARPGSGQINRQLEKLLELYETLQETIDNLLAVSVTTGTINASGPIYTPHGRATPVTTGYVGAWLNSDGRIGASVSSVVYKQDFGPANTDELVRAILGVSLVRFRYIQTVEDLGDKAPLELGAIAEYFASVGLGEYVFNNADGEPMGINYERLSIPLIAVVQRLHAEGAARDARLEALERRLAGAGL